MPGPVSALPEGYREVHYMNVTQRGVLLWLNLLSLLPLAVSSMLVFGGLIVYHGRIGAPLVVGGLPQQVPTLVGFGLSLLVLPLHEWIHGLVMRRCGHTARYGIKWFMLFATSDGGLFRRDEFLRVALAPLVLISVGGVTLMVFLPMGLAYWVALAVVINAAGAIGDLWMTVVVARFDSSALVRDEEDSIRIFSPPA
jgi:hypothetical protein